MKYSCILKAISKVDGTLLVNFRVGNISRNKADFLAVSLVYEIFYIDI